MGIKLVSELYDQCQSTFVLFSDFVGRFLDAKYWVDIMPSVEVSAEWQSRSFGGVL